MNIIEELLNKIMTDLAITIEQEKEIKVGDDVQFTKFAKEMFPSCKYTFGTVEEIPNSRSVKDKLLLIKRFKYINHNNRLIKSFSKKHESRLERLWSSAYWEKV